MAQTPRAQGKAKKRIPSVPYTTVRIAAAVKAAPPAGAPLRSP